MASAHCGVSTTRLRISVRRRNQQCPSDGPYSVVPRESRRRREIFQQSRCPSNKPNALSKERSKCKRKFLWRVTITLAKTKAPPVQFVPRTPPWNLLGATNQGVRISVFKTNLKMFTFGFIVQGKERALPPNGDSNSDDTTKKGHSCHVIEIIAVQ